MPLQVVGWEEWFESAKSKTYKHKSQCYTPNKHGLGYRRLIRQPNGPALFGAWCAMVQVLSRQAAPRKGYLTDTGLPDGIPVVSADLALQTDIPAEIFDALLALCVSPSVGWLIEANGQGHHKDTTRIPQAYLVSNQGEGEGEGNGKGEGKGDGQKPDSSFIPYAKAIPRPGHVPDSVGLSPSASECSSPIPTAQPIEPAKPIRKRRKIEYPPDFELFWQEYPKKEAKLKALEMWLKADLPPIEQVLQAIRAQKVANAVRWAQERGRYIPHPATWLNEGRWMDEARKPVEKGTYL